MGVMITGGIDSRVNWRRKKKLQNTSALYNAPLDRRAKRYGSNRAKLAVELSSMYCQFGVSKCYTNDIQIDAVSQRFVGIGCCHVENMVRGLLSM